MTTVLLLRLAFVLLALSPNTRSARRPTAPFASATSTCRAAHAHAEEFYVNPRVGPLDENVIPIEYVYLDRLCVKEAGHVDPVVSDVFESQVRR